MHMYRFLGAGAALLATSVLAAPLDLGLNLSTLNKCLFSDPLTKLRLDATKVLDLSSNTCLSTTACLATKTNQIVTQTVAGVLQVPVCQRKTCPEGVTLNSEGLCVCLDAKILVGSGSSAYCAPAPKTCQNNLVLSSAGVCVCPSGSIFKDASKTICITSDKCDTLLNVIRDGTCVPKTCSSGQFLNTITGQCASSCDTLLNTIVKVEGGSLCQPKPCGSNMTLDKSTGACVCASGFIFSNASKNTCITVSTCDLKLNEILNGVCLPKVCAGTQLLNLNTGLCISLDACPIALNTIDNGTCKPKSSCTGAGQSLINGICLCSSGFSLNSAGVCALPELLCKAGQLLNANKSACIDSAFCPLSLNYISNGVCLPRTSCSAAGQILSNGVCLCDAAKGFSLGFLGLCVKLNAGLGQGLGLGLGL